VPLTVYIVTFYNTWSGNGMSLFCDPEPAHGCQNGIFTGQMADGLPHVQTAV